MALPRSLAFQRLGTGPQVLEVYLCPTCPFSGKIARSIEKNVLPLMAKGGKYENKISLIPRVYPQPFHYLAELQSEALIYVGTRYAESFWDYFIAIYDNIEEFRNAPAENMTLLQAREKLAGLAQSTLEKKGLLKGPASQFHGQFMDACSAAKRKAGDPEANKIENLLKYNIKIGRQNGVHVTPTVLFDGLRDDNVSSSWGKEEWEKWLEQRMAQY